MRAALATLAALLVLGSCADQYDPSQRPQTHPLWDLDMIDEGVLVGQQLGDYSH